MDIIGDILPIFIFIAVSIYKVIKKEDDKKDVKKYKVKKGKQGMDNRRPQRFPGRQEFTSMEDVRREETILIPSSLTSSTEQEIQNSDLIELEEVSEDVYRDVEKKDRIKSKHTIEDVIEEGIKDRIVANEIGKPQIIFDKRNIKNAIIMAEIIGKPKALKNKRL